MSYPTEPDAAIIKMGDGATPTEVFTVVCGIENVTINQSVQTSDVYRKDCAKPGLVPTRRNRVTGKSWDMSGSGVFNISEIVSINSALGLRKNYKVEFIRRDGTDTGVLLGTYAGAAVMTANNISMGDEGTNEITFAGEDLIVWTVAP